MMKLQTSPLLEAATQNDTERIKKLLLLLLSDKDHKNVLLDEVRNEFGQTPLHVAVKNNCYEAAIMLIREGCDINAQDDSGNTPLHIAVQKDFSQIALNIFNLPSLKRDVQNLNGDTVFHLAVLNFSSSNVDIKPNVLSYMRYFSMSILNTEGYSPFHLAIKLNKRVVVEIMLEEQPQLIHQLSRNGEPPLWVALKHDHLDIIRLLLSNNGCDVNQINIKIGAPTIWLATYRQNKEAMDLLLQSPGFDKGALNAASNDGISPILLSMIRGNEKQLLGFSSDDYEWNALALKVTYALATQEDFDKIESDAQLLKHIDDHGNTLLHLAVLSDSLEMVKGVIDAGAKNIEDVIVLANDRQCPDIVDFFVIRRKSTKIFSLTKEFPLFSDNTEDLFDPLKKANGSWLKIEPNAKGQISYLDLKNYIIKRLNIEWSDIQKVKGGGIPTFSLLSQMKRIQGCDDQNTDMVRYFLSILMHIETYLREEDELFKHLSVVLLPVGSTLEGTQVWRLNELDVMFFCTELHHFLSVEDERTICISEDKYNDLPGITKDLFDLKTRKLDMAKFFAIFMQSIKKAIQDLVGKEKVPENVELFLDNNTCNEPDCKANKGEVWCQCSHIEPPCVCYTAVGAGLNFVWKGEDENRNMVFTIDIVPNFYVDLKGLSNFKLRQKLIKYLMNQKPFGWVEFLKKYIRDDRIYMGQFDLEQKKYASVGIKMINTREDFVIRSGMNMHATDMLEDEIVHETYCFLKILKEITNTKVKSFDLKKAISDQLNTSRVDKITDVFSFTSQILNSPDLKGKFDGLCKQYLTNQYIKVDLVDFPAKNCSSFAIQLIYKDATNLIEYIREGNVLQFRQLLGTLDPSVIKDMLVHGRSLLHFAAVHWNREMIGDLINVGCDANLQDLLGNVALHYVMYVALMSKQFSHMNEKLKPFVDKDFLEIVKLLTCHQKDVKLELQNTEGETVFHLLARKNLGLNVNELLLSKASKEVLDLRDRNGRTAMMDACLRNGMEDIVDNIITRGASVDVKDNDGCTALHHASSTNNCILINILLLQGANIESKDNKGRTPLIHTCCNSRCCLQSVKLLMAGGADANAADIEGCTALYHAVVNGHSEIVQFLVQSGGADVDKAGSIGTPLFKALELGNIGILKFLLMSKADANRTYITNTPLYKAAENGLAEAAQLLIDHGAEVNGANTKTGATPLYIASQNGHLQLVKLLLENEASVDLTTRTECPTPLFIASQNGHLKVAELLLKNGASVNLATKDRDMTPLYSASQNGHVDVVELLLNNGASMSLVIRPEGVAPIHIACQNGQTKVVELLLSKGASVDQASRDDGMTPLYIASHKGHMEVLELLLQNGATVDLCKRDGATPLYIASKNGHLTVVERLLDSGADPDLSIGSNAQCRTPLIVASVMGHLEIVRLLLKSWANVNKTDLMGATPLAAAAANGDADIVSLLVDNNADVNMADDGNITPMLFACHYGHLAVVQVLVEKAGVVIDDNSIDVATKSNKTDVVKYLSMKRTQRAI